MEQNSSQVTVAISTISITYTLIENDIIFIHY
jgi:hypothetical protein